MNDIKSENKIAFSEMIEIIEEKIREEKFNDAFACVRCLRFCALKKSKKINNEEHLNSPEYKLILLNFDKISNLLNFLGREISKRNLDLKLINHLKSTLSTQIYYLSLEIHGYYFKGVNISNLKQIDPDEQEKKDFFKFFYNEMDKTLKNHNLASVFSADYNLNENNSDKKENKTE